MTKSRSHPKRKHRLRRYAQAMWRRFFGLNVSKIDSLLFVGGQFAPDQWPRLHAMGIRAVLSLQAEYEDQFEGPPPERTLRLLVPDFNTPNLEQFAEAVLFIAEAHRDGLPVFVHCHAGVGRAPITAAAYLVAYHAMNSMAALGYIRAVRPIIAPNGIQMRRLQEWETLLRNKK
jgi:protein tyrosine phosphatase (PTP) superfamily phosphohydrolase (DUF442 family)